MDICARCVPRTAVSCGCPTSRVLSLERLRMRSELLGTGTDGPEKSTYVRSLDAKKLRRIKKIVVSAFE